MTALECGGTWWAFHHTGHFMSPGWGLYSRAWTERQGQPLHSGCRSIGQFRVFSWVWPDYLTANHESRW